MTIANLPLFEAIGAKMGYLNQRQSVIAGNIANANTPGYVAQDIEPVDFSVILRGTSGKNASAPVTTDSAHISAGGKGSAPKLDNKAIVFDVNPSGNSVNIEEQIVQANKISSDYSLMANLYRKQASLIRMALGGNV